MTTATTAHLNSIIGPPGLLRLSERREQLVRALAGQGHVDTETLCERLGVNRRTLQNMIEQTRTYLWARDLDIENVRGVGVRLVVIFNWW